MSETALNPFPTPDFSMIVPAGISAADTMIWMLYLVFAFWAIYSLVALYHWLKYSHASWLAFPAIAVHVFVSLALMSYGLSGDIAFLRSLLHLPPFSL
jgi:hypothetical protein